MIYYERIIFNRSIYYPEYCLNLIHCDNIKLFPLPIEKNILIEFTNDRYGEYYNQKIQKEDLQFHHFGNYEECKKTQRDSDFIHFFNTLIMITSEREKYWTRKFEKVDDLDWDYISAHINLSYEFLEKFQDYLNWDILCFRRIGKIPDWFVYNFKHKISWEYLIYNKHNKLSESSLDIYFNYQKSILKPQDINVPYLLEEITDRLIINNWDLFRHLLIYMKQKHIYTQKLLEFVYYNHDDLYNIRFKNFYDKDVINELESCNKKIIIEYYN